MGAVLRCSHGTQASDSEAPGQYWLKSEDSNRFRNQAESILSFTQPRMTFCNHVTSMCDVEGWTRSLRFAILCVKDAEEWLLPEHPRKLD